MGLWDNIFGSTKEDNGSHKQKVDWLELTASQELNALVESSYNKPQLIFKHSMTCGVSGMAKRRFEAEATDYTDRFAFHLLVIQKNRELSNQVSVQLQIRHESPQLLVVKEGVVIAHASHWQIDSLDLKDYQ